MKTYRVKSEQDFTDRVANKDVELAIIICQAILDNLDTTKKNVYVLSVEIEEDEEIYDLSCRPEEFIVTLERNLLILEDNELYELYDQVLGAINYLKQKNKL